MNIVPPIILIASLPPVPRGAVAGPPNPGGPGHHCIFAKCYTSPTADIHVGAYKAILATFVTKPARVCLTPAKIQASLNKAGDGFLQAYLFLGPNDHTITIHTITCYPIIPMVAMQWDGMKFGFLGDVVGQLPQPVEFPAATAFNLAPAVIIPMVTTMKLVGQPYLATHT